MNIYKKQSEFGFYDGQATLDGNIVLRPTALTGNGIMKLEKAEVSLIYPMPFEDSHSLNQKLSKISMHINQNFRIKDF